jgi:hypothetical protein
MGVTAFGSHYTGSITLNPKHGWQSQIATLKTIDCAKPEKIKLLSTKQYGFVSSSSTSPRVSRAN